MKTRYYRFCFYIIFLGLSFNSLVGQDTSKFNYYAVFDNILSGETNRINVLKQCLSGDGTTIFFYGKNIDTEALGIYTIKTDGTSLKQIPWPTNIEGLHSLTINYDGSRAFFSNDVGAYRWRIICKVENGSAQQIIDIADYNDINGCFTVRCTDDGEYVFFNEDRDDIWRLHHTGGIPELIINDTDVPVSTGSGAFIGDFDVSADGSKMGFVLRGYWDGGWHEDNEVYSYGESFNHLTAAAEFAARGHVRISGDGSKITFDNGHPAYKWVSINFDGSEYLELEGMGFNFGGLAIDSLGGKIFYRDANANGGRILNSDGSKNFDLTPGWNPIFLSSTWDACMNDSGNIVSFFYSYTGYFDNILLMVGHINTPNVPVSAPVIENIICDPSTMPDNDPDARILVKTYLSDIDGLEDIEKISFDHILNGYKNSDYDQLPVSFAFNPNDNGEFGDETANDNIYTIRGEPGGAISTVKQMDLRIAVQDYSHSITVADITLNVGEVTNVNNRNNKESIDSYNLYQNYPNPFNPNTVISYQLPIASQVIIKVYDILGKEISILENIKKSEGMYQVEFNGSTLSNGIYYYTIQMGSYIKTKKMILLK